VDGAHADADCAMETDEPEGDNNDDQDNNQCRDQNGNDDQAQQEDFKGKIDSIHGSTLKVSGMTVHTDHNTKIEKGDKEISLGDLKVGETMEVEGTLQADGSILVKEIKVEDDAEDDGVHH
jgi:hypothetical protein